MRCVVVNLGSCMIENAIVADPAVDPFPPGRILILAPDFVNPGTPYNGGVFIAPGSSIVVVSSAAAAGA